MGYPFELNHLYKVTLDEYTLSDSDINKIRQRILKEHPSIYVDYMPDSNQWQTERGYWTKRFKSWMYKEYHIKVSECLLSELGGMIGKTMKQGNYFVDFVDHSNWLPGSFGELPSSCWFSEYYGSTRMGLFEQGGLSMRLFSSAQQRSRNKGKRGIGRAWMLPHQDNWLLFNAYGYELPTLSKILEKITSLPHHTVDFELSGGFVNGNKAELFGAESTNYVCRPSINSRYVGVCQHCHEPIQKEKSQRWTKNNDENNPTLLYHKTCIENIMLSCTNCGLYDPEKDMQIMDGHTYCKRCMKNRRSCVSCKQKHFINHLYRLGDWDWDDERLICESCRKSLPKCPRCFSRFLTEQDLANHLRSCHG